MKIRRALMAAADGAAAALIAASSGALAAGTSENAARRVWQRIHSLPYRQSIARLSGLGSQVRMTRMLAEEAFLGERHQPAADTAVPVRVRELGGNVVWLRPRSTDRLALEFVGYGHHLPPAELTGPVKHIAVFGANIGRPGRPVPARPAAGRRGGSRQRPAGPAQPGPPRRPLHP